MPTKLYKCLIIPQHGAPYLTDWMEMTLENIYETLDTTYYGAWSASKVKKDIVFHECPIAKAICEHPRWRGDANFAEELGEQHDFNNTVRYPTYTYESDHTTYLPLRGNLMITMTEKFVKTHLDEILMYHPLDAAQ